MGFVIPLADICLTAFFKRLQNGMRATIEPEDLRRGSRRDITRSSMNVTHEEQLEEFYRQELNLKLGHAASKNR